MALSHSTRVAARATIAASGTSVAPSTLPPDNCHTIQFINRSALLVLIGQGVAGGPLADAPPNTPLLANATVTWVIGALGQRFDDLADLIFDSQGGAANVDIVYLCGAGPP